MPCPEAVMCISEVSKLGALITPALSLDHTLGVRDRCEPHGSVLGQLLQLRQIAFPGFQRVEVVRSLCRRPDNHTINNKHVGSDRPGVTINDLAVIYDASD